MSDVKSVSLASCAMANQYAAMLAEREEAAVRIARFKDETRRRDYARMMQHQAQASQAQAFINEQEARRARAKAEADQSRKPKSALQTIIDHKRWWHGLRDRDYCGVCNQDFPPGKAFCVSNPDCPTATGFHPTKERAARVKATGLCDYCRKSISAVCDIAGCPNLPRSQFGSQKA